MLKTADSMCSQQISQILMEGAQELLGADALRRMAWGSGVGAEDGCNQLAGLSLALEQQYGLAGGRGLALRVGRSAFKYLLQRHGEQLGFTSVEFRLQRAPQRLRAGLSLLAGRLAQECGDQIDVQEEAAHWVWRSQRCPVCWERHAQDASCYLTVGMIQEFMAWASGGRYHRVVETGCRAAGDLACVFRIDKQALD